MLDPETTDTPTPPAPTGVPLSSPTSETRHEPVKQAGRAWPRRVLAAAMLVIAVGAWAIAQVYQLLLFAPAAIAVGSVVHRGVAAKQGRLNTSLLSSSLKPANRPAIAQLVLRITLAVLVVAAADIALLDIEAGGFPSPTTQWLLVVGPLFVFVPLQLIPTSTVSRSLNGVVGVVAAFLAFQLYQVHYNSSAEDAVTIQAPFDGEWHVPSAGKSSLVTHHWTPLADQHYAVDFFIERDGRTYDGDTDDLTSYYCWDQPLLAPAAGTVVAAEDIHPDQPIGSQEGENLAGNTVVIEFGPDLYVQLSHLRSGSVAVEVGDQVEVGDLVGTCGNSGFSLEPHLHLQVQDTPQSNNDYSRGDGESLPFRFDDITHIRNGDETDDQTSLFRRNDRVRTTS
ncbi:MAG: M23 family metallopeptidase [Acidimicrobiales bacterium]